MSDLKHLNESATNNINRDFKIIEHREQTIQDLERLSYKVVDVLEQIAEQPQIFSLSPSWNEEISSVLEIAENATDLTIHAIAKLYSIKMDSPLRFSERKSLEARVQRIVKMHGQEHLHQKQSLSRIVRQVHSVLNEENLDWPRIDRLTLVFFDIVQAQKQYFHPESKKNR